ncbi:hypothetical protein [Chimaeribacter arupi]|uniref:hypothetical protein n=1 Tax=Chimaeribacter arupi TaxID=2060066 RepID=UPI000C795DD4|nr:hypothetical protein [Chimaeribacter arupi]PLR30063.1 hypothetical protein CYR23_18765 [Chimaeribacter arupi]
MKITHKQIKDDIDKVIAILQTEDMEIPNSWTCMRIGAFFITGITLWQMLIVSSIYDNGMDAFFSQFSVLFSFFLGFIVFVGSYLISGKYYSLPERVRSESLVIRIVTGKVKAYSISWLVLNFFIGVICKMFALDPAFLSSAPQLITLVVFVFLYSVDMSRYDLSLLSSVISAWREGKLKRA